MLLDLVIVYLVALFFSAVRFSSPIALIFLCVGFPVLFSVLIATYGQTPGKRALGLRVVSADGGPVSWGQAFLRETLGRVFSVFFLLGYVTAIGDAQKQTWHDHIARTLVVDARYHA